MVALYLWCATTSPQPYTLIATIPTKTSSLLERGDENDAKRTIRVQGCGAPPQRRHSTFLPSPTAW